MSAGRLPGFIIGGAPRCATTWLWHLLDRHPGIYMAQPVNPEPKFFLIDEVYEKGLDYYAENWFAGAEDGQLAGEKSTNYLESPVAAGRIHADLPGVRLVFILRDPAERAYSNYLWTRSNGLESESFETALELEGQRLADLPDDLKYARPFAYFQRGLYADMLQPYVELFGLERILCLRYEDVMARPGDLAGRLQQYLGVEARADDYRGLGVINTTEDKGEAMTDEIGSALARRYEKPNQKLAQLLGSRFEVWGEVN